ncbi:MAG TPA: hypothetical protein VFP21_09250 [Solirubrobacterales bacterium]|nr:hypothetical protein [Solirubrobacterales bacterium]
MAKAKKPKAGADEVLGMTRSGTVITEELAEQWATEFESEDFDPTHWERRYVRRSPFAQSDIGPGIAFPLSSSELSSLRLRAEEEGRSFSDLIRETLDS